MRQRMLSEMLRERFGTKIYKLSLSSGCTCPNRDGTIGTGGCTFCSEGGSGEFAAPFLPLDDQIRLARLRVDAKIPRRIPPDERKFIAYFQSFTNTYGDVKRLGALYGEAVRRPEIAILSVGTRPDCLSPEILDMLGDLRKAKPVWVELGLQTMHERTAERIHRGYSLPVFEEACRNLKAIGVEVIVHVILGLPGESREDMLDTIRYLSGAGPMLRGNDACGSDFSPAGTAAPQLRGNNTLRMPAAFPVPDGIKLQQLQILRGTQLAREYEKDPFPVATLEEYCALVKDCLDILPEEVVIHRLTGDGPKALLIAPAWSADKKRVLNTMHAALG